MKIYTILTGFLGFLVKSSYTFQPSNEINVNRLMANNRFFREIPLNELVANIKDKHVSEMIFSDKLDTIVSEFDDNTETDPTMESFTTTKINPFISNTLVDLSLKNDVKTIFLQPPPPTIFENIVQELSILSWGFIFVAILTNVAARFFGGGSLGTGSRPAGLNPFGMMNPKMGKNGEAKMAVTKANITLNSFAGSPEIFLECTEVVSYLKNATAYKNAGAEIPRGILLEGPPGTGKTLLAKAIASEADANFIAVAASEFVELFVGLGAAKVRQLFADARKNRPCIVFIDEIDAVGKQRGNSNGIASNDEREQTLNQILAEMDGFADNEGILIIAATNRKDILDKALLRPGRFDRQIMVPLPDVNARKDILKVHAQNKQLDPFVSLPMIAELTSGFSGAQLKNLLNEAAILTARQNQTVIRESSILEALDKITVGIIRKVDTRSVETLRRVAIHEIGHAFLANYFQDYFEVKRVSIQSTYNGAGGFTIYQERAEIVEGGLYTRDLLKKRLVIALGGKAAEEIFYGKDHVSVGAIQDLQYTNSLAQKMVANYGMAQKEMEVFYRDLEKTPFSPGYQDLSDISKTAIDSEILILVTEAYETAKEILEENREIMDRIIYVLQESKNIDGKTFRELI